MKIEMRKGTVAWESLAVKIRLDFFRLSPALIIFVLKQCSIRTFLKHEYINKILIEMSEI